MNNENISKFSVVIPLYNEEGGVHYLHKEIIDALVGYEYELIYVNDGSKDNTYYKLKDEINMLGIHNTKLVNIPNNSGQSFALGKGLEVAKYPVIVFMDGDLQMDPRDIPALVIKINNGFDFVQGARRKRNDPFFSKALPALTANFILRTICGSKFRDIGCPLKAFKKELVSDMVFWRGIHRVLPLYLMLKGAVFTEITVNHRKRSFGKTKYGMYRVFEVAVEIIRIIKYKYYLRRRLRP